MDQETLTNHIIRLGKKDLDIACKLILQEVFNLIPINVDGKNDGGTDYSCFKTDGNKLKAAFQVTTQKTDISGKAYKDAKKAIEKIKADKFYFFTSLNLDEVKTRLIENEIYETLKITSSCLGASQIASLLIAGKLTNKFFDEAGFPLARGFGEAPDYREMALHSCTIFSDDAEKMRSGVYEDTILMLLFDEQPIEEEVLFNKVMSFLKIPLTKERQIRNLFGALFGRSKIVRDPQGLVLLASETRDDVLARKRIYEDELKNLAAAQVDMMRNDFNSDWNIEDSKKIGVYISNAFITKQLELLREIRARVSVNPIFKFQDIGIESIKNYLLENKRADNENVDDIVKKLLEIASNHPLISKLARASVYVALEGSNPVSSAQAIGISRWSDCNILIEPTVALPWICSQLFSGSVNRQFDNGIRAIKQARKLSAKLGITYYYINECAGHLHKARKFVGLSLNPDEMQFAPNAFVANYYALQKAGIKLPGDFLQYLKSFSPSILVERTDYKAWIRSIMTDLQGLFCKSGVEFVEVPKYSSDECASIETDMGYYLRTNQIFKPRHLLDHDVWALTFVNERASKGESWVVLTYDRSIIEVAKSDSFKGWITCPEKFLDLTNFSRPLSENQFISLVNSFASYSERTLSAGARIIDRIVSYASADMQNWEFLQEIESFKKNLVSSIDYSQPDFYDAIDSKTDEFLASHGVVTREIIEEEGEKLI